LRSFSIFSEDWMNVHQNARLKPHSRAELVRRVVVEGQTPTAVAAAFGVTVNRRSGSIDILGARAA